MNLHDAIKVIADHYDLNNLALLGFADRDPHTGWDGGAGAFPVGSLWRVEGQILCALIAYSNPLNIVELGTHHGASATHMAAALAGWTIGDRSHITCVDVWAGAGSMIPDELRRFVTLEYTNALDWLAAQPDEYIDFLYEDMDHSAEQVAAVARLAQTKLSPGGWLVCHDAMHYLVGNAVQQGLRDGGIDDALLLLIEPSDCGLAIWRKPFATPQETPMVEGKPKAKRSKKAAE